jgi:hypothetical protein
MLRSNGRVALRRRLSADEKEALEAIYLSREVATDQLRRAPGVLADIVDAFHAATGRTDVDAALLLRYVVNRRKDKDWPRLGNRAQRFAPVTSHLTPSQLSALRTVYETFDQTSDELMFSPRLMRRIAGMFREATGTTVPGSVLVAVTIAKRKRGEWPCIRTSDRAFADIPTVARNSAG